MNWTQQKSFVNDNQKTINFMGIRLLKGVWSRGGRARGGEDANVWVRILFPVTMIEFDEYLLKLGRLRKIGHDLNLRHKN